MAALTANRAGKLSEDQQIEFRRFLTSRRTVLIVAPLVLLVASSYASSGLVPIYRGIAISIPLILFVVAMAIVRATFAPMLADVDAGVVETVTGELAGSHGKGFSVNGRRLRVTLPPAAELRDARGTLKIYVLPRSNLVVGFEPA